MIYTTKMRIDGKMKMILTIDDNVIQYVVA